MRAKFLSTARFLLVRALPVSQCFDSRQMVLMFALRQRKASCLLYRYSSQTRLPQSAFPNYLLAEELQAVNFAYWRCQSDSA